MIIKTLVENTSFSEEYKHEHGLSLYIENKDHKIMFDVGASELFFENANKLGVDISDVDYLVLSHGHYDHGGGLEKFFEENNKAKVFLHPSAFGKFYALRPNGKIDYIGIDEKLKVNKQIIKTSEKFSIDKGIEVFSNVKQNILPPITNKNLMKDCEGQVINDDFIHEQNLVIEEDGKSVVITGCAHNGIINILEYYKLLKGKTPDYVIGGFHLTSPSGKCEDDKTIDEIGEYLKQTNTKYYTCHCTGLGAYERIKSIVKDNIDYLSAGRVIEI